MAVVLLLLLAGVVWMLGGESDRKTVTAYFPRAVSVYEGSDVRVLGVAVGRVEEVVPEGTQVKVVMTYDKDVDVPQDAEAVIVSPSVVGDRYVQPVTGLRGRRQGDGRQHRHQGGEDRHPARGSTRSTPASTRLTVALGPEGANRQGALTDLLEQTAKNFGGQGEQFHQTIKDFGKAQRDLGQQQGRPVRLGQADSRASSRPSPTTTTRCAASTARWAMSRRCSTTSARSLTTALTNLGTALDEVATFVKTNRAVLGRNIKDVNRVAKVLVRQRGALDEILDAGPLALTNLYHTYNPKDATLDTNANIGNILHESTSKPSSVVCLLVAPADAKGDLCNLIRKILPRGAPFGIGSAFSQPYDPTLNGLVEVER
ncbi:MlaD family protein [Nocardioides convexus]|uniref:MlaD family protein n=1 Tax=Nocardioides convexus TaxID=2712224 RepID=UPI00241836BC|nr:MlaD family protein [Nocardioides convexus]